MCTAVRQSRQEMHRPRVQVHTQQEVRAMAEKALFKVRSQFVERINTESINQILDELLANGVINDGEREHILGNNHIRAERARYLIDTVRRKGEAASRRMLVHLQGRDPTLYGQLGLSNSVQQEPLTVPRKEDPSVYLVTPTSFRNRVALLITNIAFTDARMNRSGADKDEENMHTLLSDLGYEVVKYRNLSAREIDEALTGFSKLPKLRDTDSVMIVIMSHGKQGVICGVNYQNQTPAHGNNDVFDIERIYEQLSSESCPALVDKPKVIIIQACRGGKDGSVLISDSESRAVVTDDVPQPQPLLVLDTPRFVHKEKDFISLLSCTKDTVSYRHRNQGSLLIQCIVEVFTKFKRTDDIEELFRKVMQNFEDFEGSPKKQMPTKERCTLTKRFFFFPSR